MVALQLHPDERALAKFEALHPAARAFVEHEGLARLRAEPLHDEDRGALRQRDLRSRWDEFVERSRARLRAGLSLEASLGRPRLAGASELQRLNPAAVIEGDS